MSQELEVVLDLKTPNKTRLSSDEEMTHKKGTRFGRGILNK